MVIFNEMIKNWVSVIIEKTIDLKFYQDPLHYLLRIRFCFIELIFQSNERILFELNSGTFKGKELVVF